MFIVILTSIIALFLTYLDAKRMLPHGMRLGFILVTILACIHYDYGNDYMAYHELYYEITQTPFSWDNIFNGRFHHDSGWVLLNYMFEYFGGFYGMICFLSIIQNIIIYKFIKYEVPSRFYPYAFFVYLINTSFYLMSFSMLRQWLVVCIFLASWFLIKNRNWFWALLILCVSSTIHGSAVILIPFSFWGFISFKRGWMVAILILALFGVLLFYSDWVNQLLNIFLSMDSFELYAERYGETSEVNKLGLGFYILMIPFIVSLSYLIKKEATQQGKALVTLATVGYLLIPFTQIIPTIGRISTYFAVLNIAAIPIVYGSIRNPIVRLFLTLIFLLITIYDYLLFFSSPIWVAKYGTFKSIFSIIF